MAARPRTVTKEPQQLSNCSLGVIFFRRKAILREQQSTGRIDKVRVPAKTPGILSPVECEKLLNAAGSEILPLLAIQAFCAKHL